MDDDLVVLFLMRLREDDEFGLALEDVTRREHEHLAFEHCKKRLGVFLRDGDAKKFTISLPEMEFEIKLAALTHSDYAYEFKEYSKTVDCYNYSPYGAGAEGFGFFSQQTLAWISPHPDGPTLIYKALSKENTQPIQRFLNHCMGLPSVDPQDWPEVTPESLQLVAIRTASHGRKRFQRKIRTGVLHSMAR